MEAARTHAVVDEPVFKDRVKLYRPQGEREVTEAEYTEAALRIYGLLKSLLVDETIDDDKYDKQIEKAMKTYPWLGFLRNGFDYNNFQVISLIAQGKEIRPKEVVSSWTGRRKK